MRWSLPLAAAFSLAALPAHAAPMNAESFVVTENEALLITPARAVVTGIVKSAAWSADGRYVLALSGQLPYAFEIAPDRPPTVRSAITLWSATTGESKELWTGSAIGEPSGQIEWFAKGGAAAALLDLDRPVPAAERRPGMPASRKERWVYRVDSQHSVLKPVARVPESTRIYASPVAPVMVLWSPNEVALRTLRTDGPLTNVQIPEGVGIGGVDWLADGRAWIGGMAGPDRKPSINVILDPSTNTLTRDPKRPESYRRKDAQFPVHLIHSPAQLVGSPARLEPLWLEASGKSEKPRAIVAPDVQWAHLSPNGDAILYADDKGAWVVRPLRLPKAAFFMAREAAARASVLSNGKQLGLGLAMYAADHDETFPSANDSIVAALQPYLMNDSFFHDFTYTFAGGKLSDIAAPSEQVLGHVLGPGGRALIYADGHVTWEADGKR